MEIITPYIKVGVITLSIVFAVIFSITGKHKNFINNALQIQKGMSMSEVVDLMGEAPTTKENNNRQTILIGKRINGKVSKTEGPSRGLSKLCSKIIKSFL